ncbi:MAG: hypothetical protein ABL961_12880 [Vicinamibacterales bacterium]
MKRSTVGLVIVLAVCLGTRVVGLKPSGHRSVTEAVARSSDAKFSRRALQIIAAGAKAADKTDWENPAAHAQTRNEERTGLPNQSSEEAMDDFRGQMQRQIAFVDSAMRGGNYDEALFRLGYIFHGVQDLASHRGITNAYHRQLTRQGQDPDQSQAALAQAQRWTKQMMQALRGRYGDLLDEVAAYDGDGPSAEEQEIAAFSDADAVRTAQGLATYRFAPKSKERNEFARNWGTLAALAPLVDELAAFIGRPQGIMSKRRLEIQMKEACSACLSGCSQIKNDDLYSSQRRKCNNSCPCSEWILYGTGSKEYPKK